MNTRAGRESEKCRTDQQVLESSSPVMSRNQGGHIDVIGEWEKVSGVQAIEPGTIVSGRLVWRPGLRFEDVAAGLST